MFDFLEIDKDFQTPWMRQISGKSKSLLGKNLGYGKCRLSLCSSRKIYNLRCLVRQREKEDWEKLDLKARETIFLALSSNVLFNISDEKTTREIVDKLSSLYEIPLALNKVFIMNNLYKMKMKEGGVMSNHLNEFNTLAN